jgi:hypothetical protein
VAVMQPYFVPYLGYFQLIAAVGTFVIYDNVQYIMRGWINRNRVLHQGRPQYISIPLAKASQNRRICDLAISPTGHWQKKILRTVRSAYGRAPHFNDAFPLFEAIVGQSQCDLVGFLEHSLVLLCAALGITTRLVRASMLPATDHLRGAERILAICRHLQATDYLNPVGGRDLYASTDFDRDGIRLRFLSSIPPEYRQHEGPYVPSLSIIDVLMFNGIPQTRQWLSCCQLLPAETMELPAGDRTAA